MPSNRHPDHLFNARTPGELMTLLTAYLGRPPTRSEFPCWVMQCMGPFHIPAEVMARCASGMWVTRCTSELCRTCTHPSKECFCK